MAKPIASIENIASGTSKHDVVPQNFCPAFDMRFVMLEIGKLTSCVDRLIVDIKSQSEKVDSLRHQVSFVKGGLWVVAAVISVAIFVSTKSDAVVNIIKAII
ncbi:MAG: hypothetical protein JWQ10_3025 [Herbaspirillum sp.]|jgi:hypothetical protein|nr:hypothetical protein [Herbaspirillum sp.]